MRIYCNDCDIDMTVVVTDDLTQSCANCGKELSVDSQSPTALSTPHVRSQNRAGENDLTQLGEVEPFLLDEQEDDESPQRIGKYRVVSHVATGGFGSVFKGYDGLLDQHVAIKIPRRDRLDANAENEFVREARTMARLEHPNIVSIKEAGHDESGFVFLVMKWIEGSTLAQYQTRNKMDFDEVARLMARVARAIHFAHGEGFVHRDLKPSNILMDEKGHPFVTDFGLACEFRDGKIDASNLTAGTLPYMAPEQFNSAEQSIDHQTDVWSLGVIFYQLLTGHKPFTGTASQISNDICSKSPRALRSFDTQLPSRFEDACLKCLEKSKADRWNSAAEFADAIDPDLLTNMGAHSKATPIVFAVGSVICLLLISIGLWSWLGNARRPSDPQPMAIKHVPDAVLRNLELGKPVVHFGPESNELTVTPERIKIKSEGPTFISLGAIKDEKSIEITIRASDWSLRKSLIYGHGTNSASGFEFYQHPAGSGEIVRKSYTFLGDLQSRASSLRLGNKYLAELENGKSYDLKIFFNQHRLRNYTFGHLLDIANRNNKPGTLAKKMNTGSDSVADDQLVGKELAVVGEFGIYIEENQEIELSNLKINGESVPFYLDKTN